jgi:hypothetical protein
MKKSGTPPNAGVSLSSDVVLPCPVCSFPNGTFHIYVFPVISIDFEKSKNQEINVYSGKCGCYEGWGTDLTKLISDINHCYQKKFLEIAAEYHQETYHFRTYGIE